MNLAELFGLTRRRACWCCGGLGLMVDEWDAVEQCMFCDDTGMQHVTSQPMRGADQTPG